MLINKTPNNIAIHLSLTAILQMHVVSRFGWLACFVLMTICSSISIKFYNSNQLKGCASAVIMLLDACANIYTNNASKPTKPSNYMYQENSCSCNLILFYSLHITYKMQYSGFIIIRGVPISWFSLIYTCIHIQVRNKFKCLMNYIFFYVFLCIFWQNHKIRCPPKIGTQKNR